MENERICTVLVLEIIQELGKNILCALLSIFCVTHFLSLSVSLNAGLFYCELNWSGTQEEEEFEMHRVQEGQREGRDKG